MVPDPAEKSAAPQGYFPRDYLKAGNMTNSEGFFA